MAIRWRVLGCVVATSAGALAVSGGVLPATAATAGYVEPVVFESGASADSSNQNAQEIFRVDSDGTNLRQLTTNSVPDGDAVWSPDATRLAFTRDFQQVFTMAADGSGVHAVSPLGYAAPVWSPDGTRLAYVSVRHQQVMVSGADGSDARLVADVSPSSVRAVVWAPDGSRLAFALQHDEAVSENYDYGPPTEIDVVGADGSARHQVAAEAVDTVGQPTWSPDGTLITYHRAGGIDVVRPDGTGHHVLLPEGNDLAWSPDGRRLAVVVPANVSTDFLDVVNADGSSPRVISRAPNQEDRAPQWLADGSGVVFTGYDETTPGRSHDIYAVDADGSNYRRLTTTTVADDARTPARVVRLAGATREDTAVSLSRATHASATTVVVARDDLYPDALAAGPLAATLNAPLLLSAPNSTTAALREEVRRLGATAAYLIGDTGALSARVESDLRGAGITAVHRIGGQTRFDTAALIAEQVGGSAAYLARGVGATPSTGWEDAAAVSGLASFQHRPILLTNTDALPAATQQAVRDLHATAVTIVGGTAVVSTHVSDQLHADGVSVDRVAGTDRYATSAAVADVAIAAGLGSGGPWLATGRNFPDALAAGPAVASTKGVLLLVDPTTLEHSPPTRDWLTRHPGYAYMTAVGGPDVVSPTDTTQAVQRR